MAEVTNTAVIGDFTVRPSSTQIALLKGYDQGLGNTGHHKFHEFPSSFYQVDLYVLTTANAGAKESCKFQAPWPFTIWAADVGMETLAAGTATIDIEVDGVSILDAAEAVTATPLGAFRVAPEDGSEDVDYDSTVNIVQTQGGGAGNLVGGQAHLYCQRL